MLLRSFAQNVLFKSSNEKDKLKEFFVTSWLHRDGREFDTSSGPPLSSLVTSLTSLTIDLIRIPGLRAWSQDRGFRIPKKFEKAFQPEITDFRELAQ